MYQIYPTGGLYGEYKNKLYDPKDGEEHGIADIYARNKVIKSPLKFADRKKRMDQKDIEFRNQEFLRMKEMSAAGKNQKTINENYHTGYIEHSPQKNRFNRDNLTISKDYQMSKGPDPEVDYMF